MSPRVIQKNLRALKRGIKECLQLFKTKQISTYYRESWDKKLRQNSNVGFQGYFKGKNFPGQKLPRFLRFPVIFAIAYYLKHVNLEILKSLFF